MLHHQEKLLYEFMLFFPTKKEKEKEKFIVKMIHWNWLR
jgi:hypothetical protein